MKRLGQFVRVVAISGGDEKLRESEKNEVPVFLGKTQYLVLWYRPAEVFRFSVF
ncbi:protein of unknown function [Ruminococcaceae bacterium BL-6]|nr:protein of unknown function [Ruminococcaceae bacterium BL-6]